jgi:hypothetical protein
MDQDTQANGVPGRIYEPLESGTKQLRFATLLPSPDPLQIELSLVTVDISHGDWSYVALSYEWGSPTPKKEIVLQGQPFKVGQNLWDALIHLRLEIEDQMIWIDAICINQEDSSERGHQVGFMHDIYRKAAIVRIWLGSEGEHSPNGFSVMRDISKMRDLRDYQIGEFLKNMADDSNVGLQALIKLFFRNYWRRIWILQECVVANKLKIHCGKDSLDWDDFHSILESLLWNTDLQRTYNKVLKSPARTIWNSRRHFSWEFGVKPSLFLLLQDSIDLQSSEPRDKIYALLGLTSSMNGEIPVDYTKQLYEIKMDVIAYFNSRSGTRYINNTPGGFPNIEDVSKLLNKTLGLQEIWVGHSRLEVELESKSSSSSS